jgi:hypothetical protein
MKKPKLSYWSNIETIYHDLRRTLERIELPSDIDYMHYKAAASLGYESRTRLARKFDEGYTYYAGQKSGYREQVDDFNRLVETGGSHANLNVSSCYEEIERGIRRRRMSLEFLNAWGFLHVLIGRQHELLEQQGTANDIFERSIRAGKSQDVSRQKAWHANWVLRHSVERKRADVEYELADICAKVWRGKIKPPPGFPPEWFNRLICQEDLKPVPKKGHCGAVDLKDSFKRIGTDKLAQVAATFSSDLLPPLSLNQF